MNAHYETARENAMKAKSLCGDKTVPSTLIDAEFGLVAEKQIKYFRSKAASVKSDESKAKWNAMADAWADVAAESAVAEADAETDSELADIYEQFVTGSQGFCIAVETRCGFDISRTEIEAIASKAGTAADFQRIWGNEDWWSDENH